MPFVAITFAEPDATDAWPDLASKRDAGQVEYVEQLTCAVYQDATATGAPSVCFRFDMQDSTVILAQVTVGNMMQLMAAIKGRLEFLGIDESGKATRPSRGDAN